MKKITILLPIHKLETDDDIKMFNTALGSTEGFHDDVKILVITPVKMDDFVFSDKLDVKILHNTTQKTDFLSQINMGIDECDTEWFSILEFDDEYKKPWLSSMKEHMNTYKDVDVFLPIIKDVTADGKFLTFMNEALWAYGFSKTQGYLDNELLLEFQSFQTSGGLYRTKVIKDHGSFKDNIKLTFSYEFLLRLTYHGVNIMTVPKIGYVHVNFRENSLFWSYKNDGKEKLLENEAKFWLETAKKEYFFKNKREVKYETT